MLIRPPWKMIFGPRAHHVTEGWRWEGNVTVLVSDLDGRLIDGARFPNLITTAGKNSFRQGLSGVDTAIHYMGLGNSATAVAASDTQLTAEQFRKATTKWVLGGTGIIQTITYIAPPECNSFTIQELGWFCGPLATANPNTGILLSHVLYNRTKVATESLQVTRQDTLA